MPYADPADPRARASRLRHYRSNKASYFSRNAAQKARNLAFVRERKTAPCMDCGDSFPPVCMDFDHRGDGDPKNDHVSRLVNNGVGLKTLAAEIEKCDLVCANCHRIRTATRGSWKGGVPES